MRHFSCMFEQLIWLKLIAFNFIWTMNTEILNYRCMNFVFRRILKSKWVQSTKSKLKNKRIAFLIWWSEILSQTWRMACFFRRKQIFTNFFNQNLWHVRALTQNRTHISIFHTGAKLYRIWWIWSLTSITIVMLLPFNIWVG